MPSDSSFLSSPTMNKSEKDNSLVQTVVAHDDERSLRHADDALLAELGYKSEFKREFSVRSIVSMSAVCQYSSFHSCWRPYVSPCQSWAWLPQYHPRYLLGWSAEVMSAWSGVGLFPVSSSCSSQCLWQSWRHQCRKLDATFRTIDHHC